MKRHEALILLAVIPVPFVMAGHLETATAATLAQRQEQSQRNRYADGVYTATGQYGGQPSFITVTVTLKKDLLLPRSLEFQRSFAAAAGIP